MRPYSSAHGDDPESNYGAFVSKWTYFFKTVDEDFELERGLNSIFSHDWCPPVETVSEAIKASRRLNVFPTAVRILEAVEEKVEKKEQYTAYLNELRPLLNELGVPEVKDLGEFKVVREKKDFY